MDFGSYSDRALELVNLEPYAAPSTDDVRAWLVRAFPRYAQAATDTDDAALVRLHHALREALTATDDVAVVERLNELLRAHPVSPQIAGHDDRDWHLHLDRTDVPVGERVAAILTLGLVVALLDAGIARRGVCDHGDCEDVYLDVSPGATRRYCGATCANRANVAAYRDRKRAARKARS